MTPEQLQMDTEALRSAGLNITAQRLAVYRTVRRAEHILADDLYDRVREEIGTVSRQAVYDALNIMTENGLLRRTQPAGFTARYELKKDNHHHLVCRKCAQMVDTDCRTGAAPCLEPGDAHGFVIDEAEVIYWGLCPECQKL